MTRSELFQDLNEKHVAVAGLGISGISAAKLLLDRGAKVYCLESKSEEKFRTDTFFEAEVDNLKTAGAELIFSAGKNEVDALSKQGLSFCIMSPGIAPDTEIFSSVTSRDVHVVSELELGTAMLDIPLFFITGSVGKSTTASLLNHLLNGSNINSVLCGNIGIPVCKVINDRIGADVAVVEVSSYQLELYQGRNIKLGMILNIHENHLEWHKTFENYKNAKFRLLDLIGVEGSLIVNKKDSVLSEVNNIFSGKTFWVAEDEKGLESDLGSYFDSESQLSIKLEQSQEELFSYSDSQLIGEHSRWNIAFTLIAAKLLGADSNSLREALNSFKPLTHRLEPVGRIGDVLCINDSKATSPVAAIKALEAVTDSYPESKIVMLLGGQKKKGSWQAVKNAIESASNNFSAIICFGDDASQIASELEGCNAPLIEQDQLDDALRASIERLPEGGIVLFSPGCASFDRFRNFEERGNVFKSMVDSLALAT